MDVIHRTVSGDSAVDVGRHLDLPPTTVRTIYKNAEQIRESAKHVAPLTSKLITKQRSSSMERILAMWIDDLSRMRMPASQAIIPHHTLRMPCDELPLPSVLLRLIITHSHSLTLSPLSRPSPLRHIAHSILLYCTLIKLFHFNFLLSKYVVD